MGLRICPAAIVRAEHRTSYSSGFVTPRARTQWIIDSRGATGEVMEKPGQDCGTDQEARDQPRNLSQPGIELRRRRGLGARAPVCGVRA
jgi:hypothetical protein